MTDSAAPVPSAPAIDRTERWLLDRAFESVAAGDPIQRTMDLLVEVAGADTMEADASIVFDRVDDTFQQVIACCVPSASMATSTPRPCVASMMAATGSTSL